MQRANDTTKAQYRIICQGLHQIKLCCAFLLFDGKLFGLREQKVPDNIGINEVNIKKWANEISDKLSEKMKEAV